MKKEGKKTIFLSATGFLSGIANGLLGAGGGIIVVFALQRAFAEEMGDSKDVFANALCVMLPVSAISCVLYAEGGNLTTSGMGLYAIPALLGGLLGGFLLGRLRLKSIKKLFAALVVYSGIMLLIK